MKTRTTNVLLILAVIATLVVTFAYQLVPPKKLQLVPANNWRAELIQAYDESTQKISRWVEGDGLHFRCDYNTASTGFQFCGLNLYSGESVASGIDLSGYSNLLLNVRYSGSAPHLRLFMRNFNAAYSNVGDANSAKFLSLPLSTAEFRSEQPVVIGMNEFTVAGWWLEQRIIGREHTPAEFTNVTVIGFDFSQYMDSSRAEVDFEIIDAHFEGPRIRERHWYLSILLFWVGFILILLAGQFIHLQRRNRNYSRQITQLSSDKAHFEKQSKKYRQLSHLDPLTGALNRLGTEKYLQGAAENAAQNPLAIIILDIDHFKRVNDRRGHPVGDSVLKAVVHIIQNSIRAEDALCRWGGEEFIILTPMARLETAFALAEKIRSNISEHIFEPHNPLKITCSLGVTLKLPQEHFSVSFERADGALYKAKRQGRNCSVIAPLPERAP